MSQTTDPMPSTSPEKVEKKPEDAPSPRSGLPEWKWTGAIVAMLVSSFISGAFSPLPFETPFLTSTGYDVSNVANIQPVLYEAHGHIELLPWIGLSYSLANFAFLSFARKITYCFNLKWVYCSHFIVFLVGAVVAGAAKNIYSIIVGRIIMGWGGSVVQQT